MEINLRVKNAKKILRNHKKIITDLVVHIPQQLKYMHLLAHENVTKIR